MMLFDFVVLRKKIGSLHTIHSTVHALTSLCTNSLKPIRDKYENQHRKFSFVFVGAPNNYRKRKTDPFVRVYFTSDLKQKQQREGENEQ